MEHALFISKITKKTNISKKYSRMYFGNEFCEHLIPSDTELKNAINYTNKNNLNFSFVTPIATNKGIKLIEKRLCLIKKLLGKCEIIFNNWGVLKIIHDNDLTPVAGRLIIKQNKDPRIQSLQVNKELREHFKFSGISSSLLKNFFKNNLIERIEIDNLPQGVTTSFTKDFNYSLYYPYVYITTTRRCLVNSASILAKKHLIEIRSCNKECQKYTVELENKSFPNKIILKGNTQFFINKLLPKNIKKKGIDRVVYQPELPF